MTNNSHSVMFALGWDASRLRSLCELKYALPQSLLSGGLGVWDLANPSTGAFSNTGEEDGVD